MGSVRAFYGSVIDSHGLVRVWNATGRVFLRLSKDFVGFRKGLLRFSNCFVWFSKGFERYSKCSAGLNKGFTLV